MNRTICWTTSLAVAALLTGCSGEKPAPPAPPAAPITPAATSVPAKDSHDDHDHAAHAPAANNHTEPGHDHGGLMAVGDHQALADLKLDSATGKLDLKLFTMDGKTPLKMDEPPKVNLSAGGQKIQITAEPASVDGSAYTVTDARLKGHVHGALRITINGASYMLPLPDAHH